MAGLVEFIVRMRDMASSPMMKFAQTGQNSFSKLETGVSKFQARFNTLGMNISQIDAKLTQLQKTREISFDSSQIRRITSEIDQLQNRKNRLEGGSRSGGIGGMFRTGMALAGIGGAAYLGMDIMKAGISREISKISLETLVGKGPGDILNSQLINYAQKSIYGNEIMSEGKMLAGSGVKAKNIMSIMHMMGDIAGGDSEHMKTLALAFSEAQSTGYLTGRQEMMMRTAFFNPLDALTKVTHKSGGELKKDMEKGKIGIDKLVEAMEYATGPMGRFHNMEENIGKDGAGKWIAFTGAVSTLAGTIGGALIPVLGKLSDFLNGLINNSSALWTVAGGIGAMTVAWEVYTVATKWATVQAVLLEAAAFWPLLAIGIVGAALGQLIGGNDDYGNSAVTAAGKVTSSLDKIDSHFDKSGKRIWTIGEMIEGTWSNIAFVIQVAVMGIISTVERIINFIKANPLLHPITAGQAFVADTDADGYINKLRTKHEKHMKMFALGKNDDGTPFGSNSVLTAVDPGKYNGGTTTGGTGLGGDTTSAITGGGVRNITINVAKFQDKTEIHTVGLKEGVQDVEEIIRDMFLRIIGSAATAMN